MIDHENMKVVYIAGPYRADTEYELVDNIRWAEKYAILVWKLGAVAICPHKNTAFFGGICKDEVWLRGDLELLSRCDALFAIPRYDRSQGAKAEIEFAKSLEIPVIYTENELLAWIEGRYIPSPAELPGETESER